VTSARITVAETLELPTWTDKGSATTAEQQEWTRFSAALAAHENGHVAKDVAGFANAHVAAKAAGTVEKANTAVGEVDAKVTRANADYDTATDHGRNAGTKLNTNLGQIIKVPPSGSSTPGPTDQGGGTP
jgi:predicted secreted Zn-dependent protease